MKMKFWLASLATLFVISGCDSDSDAVAPLLSNPDTATIQVLHASPDAPNVNVLVGGDSIAQDVSYKSGTGKIEVETGTYSIEVQGILADGTTPAVIGPVDLTFATDTTYSIVAVNSVAAIEPIVIEQPRTDVGAGAARVNVLHASAGVPAVDVYVSTPGAMLNGTAPTGSFGFGETIGPAELAAGDYQIRVTAAGDMDPDNGVLFDTGTISLNDGDDLFIAAVPNTSGGIEPISLVALTGSGSAEILAATTPASLRVFHASPDAPAVDVIVNDNFGAPLISSLAFPDFVGYVGVPAADYNVKVTPAGNPGAIVIDADVSLAAGQAYDVLAVDTLAAIEPLVLNDDPRAILTNAKVRIVHASPTAQDVDIYVMQPGTDVNDVEPTLANIPFKANTGYIALPEGSYDVAVTPTGSKTVAIGPATFSFLNGDVVTVVARDAVGGGTPLNVIVTTDSIVP